jgi:hypothetical protein
MSSAHGCARRQASALDRRRSGRRRDDGPALAPVSAGVPGPAGSHSGCRGAAGPPRSEIALAPSFSTAAVVASSSWITSIGRVSVPGPSDNPLLTAALMRCASGPGDRPGRGLGMVAERPATDAERTKPALGAGSCGWAGKDLNLRPSDYESAALTAELPARRAESRLLRPTRWSTDGRRASISIPS